MKNPYKHMPMLCRKCHGPMTAKLECTKCGIQGRMMAVKPSHIGGTTNKVGSPITIDLSKRTDEGAQLIVQAIHAAKFKTYLALKAQGLAIPPDLKAEIENA